jgi:hypothetical protein
MPATGLLIWLCIPFFGAIVLLSVLSVVALSAVPLADNVLMKKQTKDGY